jgi:hypothetical protein
MLQVSNQHFSWLVQESAGQQIDRKSSVGREYDLVGELGIEKLANAVAPFANTLFQVAAAVGIASEGTSRRPLIELSNGLAYRCWSWGKASVVEINLSLS